MNKNVAEETSSLWSVAQEVLDQWRQVYKMDRDTPTTDAYYTGMWMAYAKILKYLTGAEVGTCPEAMAEEIEKLRETTWDEELESLNHHASAARLIRHERERREEVPPCRDCGAEIETRCKSRMGWLCHDCLLYRIRSE